VQEGERKKEFKNGVLVLSVSAYVSCIYVSSCLSYEVEIIHVCMYAGCSLVCMYHDLCTLIYRLVSSV
jgi:hypothetical protein